MDAKDWICSKCTLLNDSCNLTCEACGHENEINMKSIIKNVEVVNICDDNDDDIIELDPETDKPVVKNVFSNYSINNNNKRDNLIGTVTSSDNNNEGGDEESQLHAQFDEDEDQLPAETYTTYQPKKLKLGVSHPDQVVETSSLASVEPPEIKYQLKMPDEVHLEGKLSALQLEAVVYACQTHEKFLPSGERYGFFIGDGAGVGKGRTIAGMILENILNKRKKHIWLSVSNDLKLDAQRDLKDVGIGNETQVKSLNDFDYKPIKLDKCVLFATYMSLIAKKKKSSKNEHKSRLDQILEWVGGNKFDGLIIFDESHKAKNLESENGKPTQVGITVRDLQLKLPNARIVYASATGASESKNLAYMSRLGLWGDGAPFYDWSKFLEFIENYGVSAMEIVALDLKWQGIFLARQLSFSGATFEIREVDLNHTFNNVYDKSVKFWVKIKNYINDSLRLCNSKDKAIWKNFWAAHQRFFRYLCIASKIDTAVKITIEAVNQGKSVVIGLQSTGEAQAVKSNSDQFEDGISSTCLGVLNDVMSYLPNFSSEFKKVSNYLSHSYNECDDEYDEDYQDDDDNDYDFNELKPSKKKFKASSVLMENELKSRDKEILKLKNEFEIIKHEFKCLKPILPANSLDQLINDLGGPDQVAEMTGRKMHFVCNEYGSESDEDEEDEDDKENRAIISTPKGVKRKYRFAKRSKTDQKTLNIDEKNLFMEGEKRIAIISDAASCGISLHASNEAINKSKRLHITLELPWSADKAIQQFGRTHRSNQASAPDYMFLISRMAGEKRFASSVAKRIESMNALTHGDRNATKARDLSSFNLESKYGNKAAIKIIESVYSAKPLDNVNIPNYNYDFFEDAKNALAGIDIEIIKKCNVKTFLNRLLGCPVDIQNALFEYFESALEAEILLAKKENRYDEGINEIDLSKKVILDENTENFLLNDGRNIELHSFKVKSGMTWDEVFDVYSNNISDGTNLNGFYYSTGRTSDVPILATKSTTGLGKYLIYSPIYGKFCNRVTHDELVTKYRRAYKLKTVKSSWDYCYKTTHALHLHILGGSILTIFLKIKKLFADKYKLKIVRVNTSENKRVIGINIPSSLLDRLRVEIKDLSN